MGKHLHIVLDLKEGPAMFLYGVLGDAIQEQKKGRSLAESCGLDTGAHDARIRLLLAVRDAIQEEVTTNGQDQN